MRSASWVTAAESYRYIVGTTKNNNVMMMVVVVVSIKESRCPCTPPLLITQTLARKDQPSAVPMRPCETARRPRTRQMDVAAVYIATEVEGIKAVALGTYIGVATGACPPPTRPPSRPTFVVQAILAAQVQDLVGLALRGQR